MFAMTLYKCITALRREAVDNVADIWQLFLRDGIVWFLAVFRASFRIPSLRPGRAEGTP